MEAKLIVDFGKLYNNIQKSNYNVVTDDHNADWSLNRIIFSLISYFD
jgi:hypothetical protein